MPTFEQMAEQIVAAMRGYVTQATGALAKRIDAIEATYGKTAEAVPGTNGRDGLDGKDGAPGPQGPPGEKGEVGPQGERGESGTAGKDGAPGSDGKDGAAGEKGIDGRDGRDAKDGRDGKDGAPGRDALELDILPAINEDRSYPRGTFAQWNGGIVRAMEDTRPRGKGSLSEAGWRVIVNGLLNITIEQQGERTAIVCCHFTDGATSTAQFKVPSVIHRGVWREGAYEVGDQVTRQSSQWICMKDTTTEPGNGASDWILSAKKGNDGRDGKDGQPGPRGPEGRVGRDLTQLGFDGGKH